MIQLQFLNYVLHSKDSQIITENSIDSSFFSEYASEFDFIKRHIDQFGNVPDELSFVTKFPQFDVIAVNETPQYLLKELFSDKNERVIAATCNKIRDLYINGKNSDAEQLAKQLADLVSQNTQIKSVDILRNTSRYDVYVEKRNDLYKNYVKTGFPEVDKLIGGWDRKEELATIIARPGVGKCLEKGTKVLMGDGTVKCVEDVKVGDKVQGLNRINTVLGLHAGNSIGYRVIPSIGEEFTVSEGHILTMVDCTDKNNHKIVDVPVEEYASWSLHKKRFYRLYRPTVDYEKKDLEIPPYILGLWLGDENSVYPEICNKDEEVIEEWENFAKRVDMPVHVNRKDTLAKEYSLVSNNDETNFFMSFLRKNNLLNNKHIPLNYLTGSTEQRLELLAGLLDTNGYAESTEHNCPRAYGIIQKREELIYQIAQLARGLGFKVGKICKKIVKGEKYYRIHISGEVGKIPLRVKYKKSDYVNRCRCNPQYCRFDVKKVGNIEYYGFMCDGDQRYLLWDNTLTHNTFCLIKCAVEAAKQGLTVGLYSGEMSVDKVAFRVDTLISGISNMSILRGNAEVQNSYQLFLKDLPNKFTGKLKVLTPAMIGELATVSQLRAFIEKENLDILFVDQHSLLEDERHGKTPVEKAANISKSLKALQVLKQIPIISVSQMNRMKSDAVSGEEDEEIDLTQVAQTDRIGQDSTVVIGLTQKNGVLTLHLIKSRDSVSGKKLKYAIDLDKGIFNYIPIDGDANNGQGSEELKQEYDGDIGEDVF